MNKYTITSIDQDSNAVYTTFEYHDHVLNHTTFVEDLKNKNDISQAIQSDYDAFKKTIDSLQVTPDLPQEVSDLIGQSVEE